MILSSARRCSGTHATTCTLLLLAGILELLDGVATRNRLGEALKHLVDPSGQAAQPLPAALLPEGCPQAATLAELHLELLSVEPDLLQFGSRCLVGGGEIIEDGAEGGQ